MKLLRTAALIGIGKKLYDEAQKPHNQRKIKEAMGKAQGKTKRRSH